MMRFFQPLAYVFVATLLFGCQDQIENIYLTWDQVDTSTGMTVHYNTDTTSTGTHIYYDTVSRAGSGVSSYAFHVEGSAKTLDSIDRVFHRAELTGLQGGTTYFFVAGDPGAGFSEELKFKTIPNDGRPVSFVIGGDMGTSLFVAKLTGEAAKLSPDFAVVGGDIAYADGELENWSDWRLWFDMWEASMVSPGGYIVPMMVAIGNHETNDVDSQDAVARAPFFSTFFPQGNEELTYFTRTFGGQIAFIALDSSHVFHHHQQVDWLTAQLEQYQDYPATFVVYHRPLYPGHRSPDTGTSAAGRREWGPVFDQFKVNIAFEHHDHVLKRTPPLIAGEEDPDGVVYVGDGCWGRPARTAQTRPYLHGGTSLKRRHFWHVEVAGGTALLKGIDAFGNTIDEFELEL